MKILDIKNRNLVYMVERIEPYFASSIIIRGMLNQNNVKKILGWKAGVRWVYVNNYFFVLKNDSASVQKELKNKFKKNGKDYAENLVGKCLEFGGHLLETSRKIEARAAKKNLSSREMHDLLKTYSDTAGHYMIFQNIVLFEKQISRLAHRLAGKYAKDGKSAECLINLVTVASRLTASEQEYDDFLKLCLNKNREKMALEHAKKYGWLSLRFFVGQPWTKEEVLERARKVKPAEAKKELAQRMKQRIEKEKSIASAIINFSEPDKELVKLIRDIVYLRSQRTDFFQESSGYVQELVKKIAIRLGVSYYDLLYLSAVEVLGCLKNKIDYQDIINQEKKGFVAFFDYDKDKILESDRALSYINQRPALNREVKNFNELKGKSAFGGKAVGTVKIVKVDMDNKKVRNGDVLVSTMTTTNFIPALRRAAAIVTDEGGITCHAAIIAREMKKPCIIGTKIATKVLHDGDLVEVDADKGVVKII